MNLNFKNYQEVSIMTTQNNTDSRFVDPFTWEDLYKQQVNHK